MITLYEQHSSGNCYKVRLLLTHLDRPFRTVEVSARDGSTRRADYLARNPMGQVPAVALEDGRFLAQSNAILLHFAEGTALLPSDSYARAKCYEWLFYEQYDHEPTIAVRKALLTYPERAKLATPERLAQLLQSGNRALGVMEQRLASHDWLAGRTFSIADIALYGYTHTAEEGGFDLSIYPGIRRWLARVAGAPGHILIDD